MACITSVRNVYFGASYFGVPPQVAVQSQLEVRPLRALAKGIENRRGRTVQLDVAGTRASLEQLKGLLLAAAVLGHDDANGHVNRGAAAMPALGTESGPKGPRNRPRPDG